MSYLDNLENNLKALESREERDPESIRREREKQEAARLAGLQAAPFAEALKNGPFTAQLLTATRVIGHEMRTLVRFCWIGSTLRLEAKDKKLELQPTAEGVRAAFFENGAETAGELVDLEGDAEGLARRWLQGLGAR